MTSRTIRTTLLRIMLTLSRPGWIRLMAIPTFRARARLLHRKPSWTRHLVQALLSPQQQAMPLKSLSSQTWKTRSLWDSHCSGSEAQIRDSVKGHELVLGQALTLCSRIVSTVQINQLSWIQQPSKDRPLQDKNFLAKACLRTIMKMPCSDRWTLVMDLYPH